MTPKEQLRILELFESGEIIIEQNKQTLDLKEIDRYRNICYEFDFREYNYYQGSDKIYKPYSSVTIFLSDMIKYKTTKIRNKHSRLPSVIDQILADGVKLSENKIFLISWRDLFLNYTWGDGQPLGMERKSTV